MPSSTDRIAILYNNTDLFYPQPAPFIGVSEDNVYYGELWAKKEVFTLHGQLTGCNFNSIYNAQQILLSGLTKNYQPLKIYQYENGVSGLIYEKDITQIESINFDSSRWIGILPYNIVMSCYPSGYFSGTYGVLEPVDTWNYRENNDYTSHVTHTISCKGLNTSCSINNSLDNARNWVLSNKSISSEIAPILIENLYTGNFALISSTEEINRNSATYSIVDTYISDLARTGYGILRYSTTFESGTDKINTTLNGSVRGCSGNLNAVRSTFTGLNLPATAALSYQKAFNRNDLNPIPIIYNITEDPLTPIIHFSYAFDNDNSPPTVFDYDVKLTSGNDIRASINGNITTRGGDLFYKATQSKNYANTLNLYNIVTPFYNNFYPYATGYPLNPTPISSGISINEFTSDVILNCEFTNQLEISNTIAQFDYILNFQPSVQKIDSKPTVLGTGGYSSVDLGYSNRAILNINGNALVSASYGYDDGVNAIRQFCQNLFNQYGRQQNAVLEVNDINSTRFDKRLIQFNFTWSFDSTTINLNYSGITQLNV